MTRFIEGRDRRQSFLLPECVDDYVDEDNPVRVVDAFVDHLDLAKLGSAAPRPPTPAAPATIQPRC